uniref:Uncharacterized protein n=1 Tax=Sciurus vulgaris TaxID=55149 RepID=A0A8D2B9K7_SCIVU
MQAVENGDSEKVASLLGKKGASTTKHDSEGKTAFHLAAAKGHVCRFLLDHGADVNSRDKNGRTALMLACEIGSSTIVEALIKKGADLNLVDSLGHNGKGKHSDPFEIQRARSK